MDWLVIFSYLLGITVIGTWAMKRVRSTSSFFIGDRKFGKVMMMFFTFGTGTHSDQAVSVDDIENHTGLDFFVSLTKSEQKAIEEEAATDVWTDPGEYNLLD